MRVLGQRASEGADDDVVVELPKAYRGLVWRLGLGAFGLAFSITAVAAVLPPFLGRFTDSRLLIALVLGSEGAFALTLPLVIGPWSDTFHTPLGRRRPFMLAALGPMCFALLLLGFMPNLWLTALVAIGFFAAYYVYEPPYRGLYPDLLPDRLYGRAQSVQHLMRAAALGLGLVGSLGLFRLSRAAPFLVAGLVTTAACGAAVLLVRETGGDRRVFEGVRAYLGRSWQVVRDEPEVRRFLLANTAWEATFAAARTFAFLYVTKGLHQSSLVAWAVLGTVAGGYVVAAAVAGPLGDRFGLARVIFLASFLYGGGLLAAGVARHWHNEYFALIFPVSIAAGIVMTLAWGLLFKLMPPRHRGAISGLATMTKGVGLLVGPLVIGATTDGLRPYLRSTDGWQVLWPLCALPVVAAIPLVARLVRAEGRGAVTPSEPEPFA